MAEETPQPARGNLEPFRLVAEPALETVTVGAVMRYRIERNWDVIGGGPPLIQWYYYNDNTAPNPDGSIPCRRRAIGWVWEGHRWDEVGRYTIVAIVNERIGGKVYTNYYRYKQHVEDIEVALFRDLRRARQDGLPNPLTALNVTRRYAQTLKDVAAAKGVPPSKQADHDKTVKYYEDYRRKLFDLLSENWYGEAHPVAAVHIEKASQRRSKLNVFLTKDRSAARPTWTLVDWTNPMVRERTGVYTASGETDEAAIRAVLDKWDGGNRYYDGLLMCQVPAGVCGKPIFKQFETDGASTWDSVASFFEWVALGTAVVAGIVTLVAPVPGSQVVSAMIWTSIFSSTAAAVINIGQRHEEGFGNWKDDAFDGLTIVGNLFAGAGTWAKGGAVIAKNAQGQTMKYILVGQIGTDSVQGVLIAADHMQKYDAIMNDTTLSPQERTDRLLELFRSLAIAGTMTYVSVQGNRLDLENLNKAPKNPLPGQDTRTPAQKLEDLKKPGGPELDTTRPPPVEGHTDQGRQKTTVDDRPQRRHKEGDAESGVPGRTRPRAPRAWPEPPSPRSRGMRDVDDLTFAEKAREKGVYIFVRDGNPDGVDYIGKPGHKGKPETMKAKTAKEGEYVGLVCFHPDHERTLQMLAGEPPATTVEALKANPAEKQKRYDYFKEHKINEKGFHVGEPPHYLVMDAQGNRFHGDYDLHGVYGKDGRLMDSKGIRDELNNEFGSELILHGAHDEWPDRNIIEKAGANCGPQPPCVVYTPDGKSHHLPDRKTMKEFYLEHGLDWEGAYGEFERKHGRIATD